ncbi:SDR family oxidoreductase [Sporolactobacillus shoreae]|uniref:SDR family oxidoreductase n=1 Tax=Sporolactobacillus shoreae TaxID=1465501 RepID=A0A4Z0GT72_9BACL|nr:SDR family oxidoreductase [Sporolactobacillus shoreae]TGB00419.1 SDR family oxidoreductase [Sporolactobacillus shoreae]
MILSGKNVLVTGGSRGLGRAVAETLATSGAAVIINYAHHEGDAVKTAEDIRKKGGRAYVVHADVTDEHSVNQLSEKIIDLGIGTVDILVNNATGPQPEKNIEECSWQDYLDQLVFTVKAPLLLTKMLFQAMKEKHWGRIINIGSEVVQLGSGGFSNYVTAKSAMIGMTRSWATELGPFGITVNLVNPGFIPVERHQGTGAAVLESYSAGVPLGHMGKPQDIGEMVTFLASERAKFITGQSISVNGGNTFGI